MTVQEAAKLLGKSEQFVRVGLRRGFLPFGTGYKTDDNNKNYCYIIYRKKFLEYAEQIKKSFLQEQKRTKQNIY